MSAVHLPSTKFFKLQALVRADLAMQLSSTSPCVLSPVCHGCAVQGIPVAPTFRPTPEEFMDPLAYIEKIKPEGEK